MSPGSVTEVLDFHLAEYTHDMKDDEGNGNAYAEENIEVTEPDFEKVFKITESGKIKSGKTIMLFYYIKLHNLMDNTLMQDFM